MRNKSPGSRPDRSLLAYRIRRLGWAVIGDAVLVDRLLEEAAAKAPVHGFAGDDAAILAWAFRVFDVAGRAVGNEARGRLASHAGEGLAARLHALGHEERVAVALLLVEEFAPDMAERLSGRAQESLLYALARAMDALDKPNGGA